ncbi:MAG TPA: tyrosine-type recombinase/integrase [Candidatus Bathyarchaeia archaeon]
MHITNSPALEYWKNELASKDPATKKLYLHSFDKFLQFTNKTPDELLTQRQQDQTNPDRKIQRKMESLLNNFISKKRQDGFATATLQVYFASVRSFFEIHYHRLIMRKGDYPKGESIGVRVATKEAILKATESKRNRDKTQLKAIILFLKDSGPRESDALQMNYAKIAEGLERGDSIIQITIVTEKQHTIAKTFIGEEAIQAIKEYLKERRTGSRRLPPEIITDKSPLFRTWQSNKVKRLSREGLASLVRQAFLRVNEANISPHSLRKFLQTNLEAGNVNVNWIDQTLGHKLINSRDAYSKPTDEQLKEAYTKAYKHLKVYPDITPKQATPTQTTADPEKNFDIIEIKTNDIQAIKKALQNGYRHTDTVGDIRPYLKN